MKKAYIADFGAGNTCLYSVDLDAVIHDPTPLTDPNGEPSGYIRGKNGKVRVGNALRGIGYEDLERYEKYRINLKAKPTAENQEELILYFRSWLEKITAERACEFDGVDEPCWFIGIPTGDEWKAPETRAIYHDIFTQAGYKNVTLVPESNAALAYFQKTHNILDGYDSQKSALLLLDQGAYSLDATVYGENGLTSMGSYLGASLIERMLLRVILYGEEEKNRQSKSIHNMPDALKEAQELYERADGQFKTYLLLHARLLKEDYFIQERGHMLQKGWDVVRPAYFASQKGYPLSLFVNEKMMKSILCERSVRALLGSEFAALPAEVQTELGNQTWMQAFESFLTKLAKTYPQFADHTRHLRVMLTGGGSGMKCIAEAVRKAFPKAIVYDDPKAITAIGMGMAYWAPDKVNANHFEEVFVSFLTKTEIDNDGDEVLVISSLIEKHILECIFDMMQKFSEEEVDAVKDSFAAWRSYQCSSREIPRKIKEHFNAWLKNTGTPEFEKNIDSCIADLKKELNTRFEETLKQNGMEPEILLSQDDQVFLSDSKSILQVVLSLAVNEVTDYYEKLELWTKFPDEKKRLFSDPRAQFASAVADHLAEWLKKQIDGTLEMYASIFTELEIPYMGEERSFFACFKTEAFYDLLKQMQKRKQEILGNLVLEEYQED